MVVLLRSFSVEGWVVLFPWLNLLLTLCNILSQERVPFVSGPRCDYIQHTHNLPLSTLLGMNYVLLTTSCV